MVSITDPFPLTCVNQPLFPVSSEAVTLLLEKLRQSLFLYLVLNFIICYILSALS